jgi:tankyrase
MKHPLFEAMGDDYPQHLEAQFDRILTRIEQLWELPEQLDDYFSDLLIDKRGGRQGFPREVLNDILRVRAFRESESLSAAERAEDARRELSRRGYTMDRADFFRALDAGDIELIDLYVRARFNIHITDARGATPMLAALKRGYTVIAQILLKAGNDVNAADRLGLSPLLVACGQGSEGFRAIAKALITRGARIEMRDPLGNTPFLLAAAGGMLDIAELLLQRGADPKAVNRRGENAYMLAQKHEDPTVIERLR